MHFTLEHIRHGVVTRLTPIQEECCLYSAIGKHTAALGHMADGHNLFRAVKNGTWSAGEQVGDLVVMDVKTDKPNAGVHTVMLNKCYNTKLENVTVYGSNTFSFFEKEGYANEYRNCVVDRGPMPQCIRPRLRSGNADGIHSSQARKGPTVTGCKVGHNGDDCIIVCGRSFPVGSADAAKGTIDLVTRETHPVFRRGDRLVVVGYDGKRKGELRLVSVSRFDPTEEQRNAVTTGYPSLLSKASYKLGFRLKVKQMPFEIGPGDVVFNADAVGSGFLVKDNEVGHVRSRGILIKGIDGVVASNRITGCAMQGILMSPEIEWMGGGFSSNVQIVGNTIEECMFERGNPRIPPGALSLFYITGDAKVAEPGAFINITVQKNKVTGCPCPAIAVTSVDGLKMSDNEVENSKEVTRSHGERTGTDTGRISFDDAYDVFHAARTDTGTGAGTAGCRVGTGAERIGTMIDVEHGRLGTFKQYLSAFINIYVGRIVCIFYIGTDAVGIPKVFLIYRVEVKTLAAIIGFKQAVL